MTSTEPNTATQIEQYVAAVGARLGNVAEDERTEMLEDLREHLLEVVREQPGVSLHDAVGSPADYAEELLASAGVTASTSGPRSAFLTRTRGLVDQLPMAQYIKDLEPVLRPTWWVLRAFLAAGVVLAFLSALLGFGSTLPFPEDAFGVIGITLLTLAFVPWSVAIGKRNSSAGTRRWILTGNAALLFLAFVIAVLGSSSQSSTEYIYENSALTSNGGGQCLTDSGGQAITNIYAYGLNGQAIDQVVLVDQNGRAIDNLCPEFSDQTLRTEYAKDANGADVYNVFPRQQWLTETDVYTGEERDQQIVIPPAIVTPRIETTTTTAAPDVTAATTSTTAAPLPEEQTTTSIVVVP